MTEQEFRERLKRAAHNDGLTPERQMQVLARTGKEVKTVRISKQVRIAFAVVLVLMLGMTGAVAGGRYLVDWQGKRFSNQVASDPRILELMDKYSTGQAVSVLKWDAEDGEYRGVLASDMELVASSLEKLQSWVETDGTLPWPVNIPEAYQHMGRGEARYVCKEDGEFRLRKQEMTEDGYIVSCFQLPNDHRLMDGYTIYLYADKWQNLSIWVQLSKKQYMHGLPATDGSNFTDLNVDGMLQAVAIQTASETRLALRQEVQPPLIYKTAEGLPDGVVEEHLSEYDCLEIEIIGQGSPADLLAIFGLEAQ